MILSSADIFFKISLFLVAFSKMIFREYQYRVQSSLDPDHARRFVGPDLGPNCLQRYSAGDNSM